MGINLTNLQIVEILNTSRISYEIANHIAEPFVLSMYDDTPENWEFTGKDKIPGKDAVYKQASNFEVKVDGTKGTPNVFIELGQATSNVLGSGFFFFEDVRYRASGFNVLASGGVYAVYHAESATTFFFKEPQLRAYLKDVRERFTTNSEGQRRIGALVQVYEKGTFNLNRRVLAPLCDKIVRYNPYTDSFETLLGGTEEEFVQSKIPTSLLKSSTGSVAVTEEAYREAKTRQKPISLNVDGVDRTIPFENLPANLTSWKGSGGRPDFVLISGALLA